MRRMAAADGARIMASASPVSNITMGFLLES